MQAFTGEAAKQLEFLNQHGFAGPDVEHGTSPGTAATIRYRRGDVAIEASLVLWYRGEEYVATILAVEALDGAVRRPELARNTVHTGYQMRRALRLQAKAVQALLAAAG